jgi:hypothetical protein
VIGGGFLYMVASFVLFIVGLLIARSIFKVDEIIGLLRQIADQGRTQTPRHTSGSGPVMVDRPREVAITQENVDEIAARLGKKP